MQPSPTTLKVLFVAAEAAPLVKIGGLGDYVGSLPKALQDQYQDADTNLDVRIIIPYNESFHKSYLEGLSPTKLISQHNNITNNFDVYSLEIDAITYFILKNTSAEIQHQYVYTLDTLKDGEKYIAFSLACLDLMRELDWKADIVQVNDWQTGVVCHAVRQDIDGFFDTTRSIFMIHNLPFMGSGCEQVMQRYNIRNDADPNISAWAYELPITAGIANADQIITVSPTYAKEILTPAFGNDLETYLRTKQDKLKGILNGLDVQQWDPAHDPNIKSNYDWGTVEKKKENKVHLQKMFDLVIDPHIPLLVMVSRLDRQKGIELLIEALQKITTSDWQAIILGTGSKELERSVQNLEHDLPQNVRVLLRFDSALSHLFYAGGDIFLMPSLYEPCGISQMIAMRYGCIPVAHAVGGLVDSIDGSAENRTGFLFSSADPASFRDAIKLALDSFKNPAEWYTIQKRAMQQDFSWKNSAKEYYQVYKQLTG